MITVFEKLTTHLSDMKLLINRYGDNKEREIWLCLTVRGKIDNTKGTKSAHDRRGWYISSVYIRNTPKGEPTPPKPNPLEAPNPGLGIGAFNAADKDKPKTSRV